MKLRHLMAAVVLSGVVFVTVSIVQGGRGMLRRERAQAASVADGLLHVPDAPDAIPSSGDAVSDVEGPASADESPAAVAQPQASPAKPEVLAEAVSPAAPSAAPPEPPLPAAGPPARGAAPVPGSYAAVKEDFEPPTPPTIVAGEAVSSTRVSITWRGATDDVGVTHYEVLSGDVVILETSNRSVTIAELAPTSRHCFKVRAYDAAGRKSPTTPPLCVTTPDPNPPSTPERLVANSLGEEYVVLKWGMSIDDLGIARYEILRGNELVATADGLRADEYGLRAGTRYCYTVTAVDVTGNRSLPSAEACVVTPDLTPPTPPSAVHAAKVTSCGVQLAWRPAEDTVGVTAYEVMSGDKVLHSSTETGAKIVVREQGRERCFRVRALDAAGHRSVPSSPLCVTIPISDPPRPPAQVTAVPNSRSTIGVSWKQEGQEVLAVAYDVLRDGVVVAPKVTTRFWLDAHVERGREYCYAVRAYNAVDMPSAPTEVACSMTAADAAPGSPFAVETARGPDGEILVSWQPTAWGAAVYAVYDTRRGKLGTTADRTFRAVPRPGDGPPCFVVSALDEDGRESARSPEACVEEEDDFRDSSAPAQGSPPAGVSPPTADRAPVVAGPAAFSMLPLRRRRGEQRSRGA